MIVRMQAEGQWELSQGQSEELDRIDNQLVEVVGKQDVAAFQTLMHQLHNYVRKNGRRLPPEEIKESDLILPPVDATMDEVKELFAGEGMISS